jgi:hypothetical protein
VTRCLILKIKACLLNNTGNKILKERISQLIGISKELKMKDQPAKRELALNYMTQMVA